MSHAIVAPVLVGHGLITSMIGFVAVTSPNAPAMALPSWFGWWPGPFGRSWLFEALGFGVPASVIGGFVWLIGGLLIIAGGLGWVSHVRGSNRLLAERMPRAEARVMPDANHGWGPAQFPDIHRRMVAAWIEDRALPAQLVPETAAVDEGAAAIGVSR